MKSRFSIANLGTLAHILCILGRTKNSITLNVDSNVDPNVLGASRLVHSDLRIYQMLFFFLDRYPLLSYLIQPTFSRRQYQFFLYLHLRYSKARLLEVADLVPTSECLALLWGKMPISVLTVRYDPQVEISLLNLIIRLKSGKVV